MAFLCCLWSSLEKAHPDRILLMNIRFLLGICLDRGEEAFDEVKWRAIFLPFNLLIRLDTACFFKTKQCMKSCLETCPMWSKKNATTEHRRCGSCCHSSPNIEYRYQIAPVADFSKASVEHDRCILTSRSSSQKSLLNTHITGALSPPWYHLNWKVTLSCLTEVLLDQDRRIEKERK